MIGTNILGQSYGFNGWTKNVVCTQLCQCQDLNYADNTLLVWTKSPKPIYTDMPSIDSISRTEVQILTSVHCHQPVPDIAM